MKIINIFKKCLISLIVLIMSLIVYGYFSVPDVINTFEEEKIKISGIYTVNINKDASSDSRKNNKDYESSVKLFNKIPVKTANAIISERKYVVPSGEIIGLRMFTRGVLIISVDNVLTANGNINPSKKCGIKSGDLIVSIDSNEVRTAAELSSLISDSGGKSLEIVYVRNEKEYTVDFQPVLSSDGSYKAGWWIRDSAAGIGTMTYYDIESREYGGLGHGICDTDTEQLLPLYYGDIVKARISGCYKGAVGKAGELSGSLLSEQTGVIYKNCKYGVFGILNSVDSDINEIPVALSSEVHTGKATILCTVDDSDVNEFEVEIEKIDMNDKAARNFIIKITDEELLSLTGGIVQGMSGSPIIQDDRLVGAVTHVLVNNPEKGYGIFIDNMMNATG